MFPDKPKKSVHYSPSTRQASRDSRDSGIGSSTASDRASFGTSPSTSPFNSQKIKHQRNNPNALSEALHAANQLIQRLKDDMHSLKDELKESHKEVRRLKQERSDILEENKVLRDELAIERKYNDNLIRQKHSRSSSTTSASSMHSAAKDSRDNMARRGSIHQALQNVAPVNPFTPLAERPGYERPRPIVVYASSTPTISYPPSTVSYAASNITYDSAPYSRHSAPAVRPSNRSSYQRAPAPAPVEDGDYHFYPI